VNITDNFTGLQHIGIPTNDIEETVKFYKSLGFEAVLRTINAEANEKVAFMRLNGLTLEIYENRSAVMSYGAVDHIALNVKSVDEAFKFVNESGLNNTKDSIHFLPFWENGVKFFTIEGPNKEKIEFSQYL